MYNPPHPGEIVRYECVEPRGLTITRAAKGLGVSFEELWEGVLAHTPLRKHALHEEVANAALFLASSDSSHTTGEALNVSGGRLMS